METAQQTIDKGFVISNQILNISDYEDSDIIYPESDGEPMGETGFHVRASMYLYGALSQYFIDRKDIYVAANMFLYYEKRNPRANKVPDVMVIKGVDNYERRTFKIWEENAIPCVIFEITSKSTAIEDLMNKSKLYESLRVSEYFLFDPLGEYLESALIGFRLKNNVYLPINLDSNGRLFSKELGVFLTIESNILRIIDAKTNNLIPSLNEAIMLIGQEAQRAEQETKRAEQEAQRAEQEAQRAEQEAQRAKQEAQRADAAEAETKRLEAIINQLKNQ
ncbi:putative restriction endonuclease domain-containing protein [Candidatus Magnetomoraceae bacterium gMMP-15]